jgi:electron transfer flavoprotein beta subunit
MAAKKKELKTWSIDDLGVAPEEAGPRGALAVVRDVFVPRRDHQVEIFSGTPVEAATQLVERLHKETGLV